MAANEEYNSVNNRSWLDKDRLIKLSGELTVPLPEDTCPLTSFTTHREESAWRIIVLIAAKSSFPLSLGGVFCSLAAWLQLIMILYKLFLFFCSHEPPRHRHNSAACSDAVKQGFSFLIQTEKQTFIHAEKVSFLCHIHVASVFTPGSCSVQPQPKTSTVTVRKRLTRYHAVSTQDNSFQEGGFTTSWLSLLQFEGWKIKSCSLWLLMVLIFSLLIQFGVQVKINLSSIYFNELI